MLLKYRACHRKTSTRRHDILSLEPCRIIFRARDTFRDLKTPPEGHPLQLSQVELTIARGNKTCDGCERCGWFRMLRPRETGTPSRHLQNICSSILPGLNTIQTMVNMGKHQTTRHIHGGFPSSNQFRDVPTPQRLRWVLTRAGSPRYRVLDVCCKAAAWESNLRHQAPVEPVEPQKTAH